MALKALENKLKPCISNFANQTKRDVKRVVAKGSSLRVLCVLGVSEVSVFEAIYSPEA